MFSPLTAGVLSRAKLLKAFHMASNEAHGRGFVAFEPGYNVGMSAGNCSLIAILTTSNTTSTPGEKTRSPPVTADTSTRNSRLKSEKGVLSHTPKVCNLVYPSTVLTRSKCVTSRRRRRVKASGPDAPPSNALDTCPKKSSIKVVMRAVVGLSGVMARLNARRRGWIQPGTHPGARTPSWQLSSQGMNMSVIADRTERVSCCVPSELFKEAGNGSTEIRDTSL